MAIEGFIRPVVEVLASGKVFKLIWPPGGPWKLKGES